MDIISRLVALSLTFLNLRAISFGIMRNVMTLDEMITCRNISELKIWLSKKAVLSTVIQGWKRN